MSGFAKFFALGAVILGSATIASAQTPCTATCADGYVYPGYTNTIDGCLQMTAWACSDRGGGWSLFAPKEVMPANNEA
jgi:hypothetical protein